MSRPVPEPRSQGCRRDRSGGTTPSIPDWMKDLIASQLLVAICLCGCAGASTSIGNPSPSLVAAAFLDAVQSGNLAEARAMMHPDAVKWEESLALLSEEMHHLSYRIHGERIEKEHAEVDILFRQRTGGVENHDDLELKLHRGRWRLYGL
jgi:hypothetical protein